MHMNRVMTGLSLPFILGYALNFTWVCSVFFHSTLFAREGNDPVSWNFYLCSMAFLIATMAAIGCGGARLRAIWERTALLAAVAAIICIGTVTASFASLQPGVGQAAFLAGAALTGIGSACVLIAWGCCLARLANDAVPNLCAAYMLAMVFYTAVSLIPAPAFLAIVSILPAGSLVVFICSRNRYVAETPHAFGAYDETENSDSEGAGKQGRGHATNGAAQCEALAAETKARADFFARTCIAAALFGVALGVMNGTLHVIEADSAQSSFPGGFAVGCIIPLVAIFAYFQAYRSKAAQEERLALVYRISLLAMAGSFLFANDTGVFRTVLSTVSLPGYICFKVLLWALFAYISRASHVHPVRVFAVGEACISAGLLAGNGCMRLIASLSPGIGNGSIGLIVDLCVALLLFAYIFVLNERKIIAIATKDADDKPHQQRFTARCHALAGERQLSKRETEILILFARGRSAARIADDLYISSGTVSTHLRNIYRKLEVHSRQELIDLIEGTAA